MRNKSELIKLEKVTRRIFLIRGQRVIMDSDLAGVYGVKTKSLNLAVKRNGAKFPADFMFQLTRKEDETLRFQIETSKKTRGGRRYLPYAFTEHGAIMAANVLNSPHAIQMSVFVVRAFIKMRSLLSDNKKLAEELRALEKKLTGRLNVHEIAIVDVLRKLMKLLEPPPEVPIPEKPPIGFQP
ncbi:MAG TPA: ORF6N domain-containing protein [Candidatus Omnitrophota bacterium]|nr:ORF6N domain-containing protein [Candidatus Omnitrophota bacterium]HPS36269.1 ORF6N domain-containing protein [Candidatus Omnitrophota bacterium]